MDGVRIDKWLWAARFYKTRALANAAVSAGHIDVEGKRVKPAFKLKIGARVKLRRGDLRMVFEVDGLLEKRGSATVAQALYRETQASEDARESQREKTAIDRVISSGLRGTGKPDKHARRALRSIKEQDH